jgi:hypothetical protein
VLPEHVIQSSYTIVPPWVLVVPPVNANPLGVTVGVTLGVGVTVEVTVTGVILGVIVIVGVTFIVGVTVLVGVIVWSNTWCRCQRSSWSNGWRYLF